MGAVVWLLLLPPTAWGADSTQRIYDTKRVLEHEDNECVGVPECRSVASRRLVVGADEAEGFAVSCREAHGTQPYCTDDLGLTWCAVCDN